jgi:hypothetical protein
MLGEITMSGFVIYIVSFIALIVILTLAFKGKANIASAIVTAVGTLALAFATMYLAILANGQLSEMQNAAQQTNTAISALQQAAKAATEANDLTQRTFIAAQRPWIFYDTAEITEPLVIDENRFELKFTLFIKNYGRTPAKELIPWPSVVFLGFNQQNPVAEQKKWCESARHLAKAPNSRTLGPSDTVSPLPIGVRVDGETMHEVLKGAGVAKNGVLPIVIGCIDYQSTFENVHHQTAFMFNIYRVNPTNPSELIRTIDPSRSPIPAKELRFSRLGFEDAD